MTLCPVALVVGCEKCSLFKICPLKAVIGSHKKEEKRIPYVRTVHGGKYWKSK
jgi:hypothetical protein